MSQPLVTIVTPTYNRPVMFAECAAAVLAQRFTEWVWWVVINLHEWDMAYDSDVFNDPRVLPIWYPVNELLRPMVHVPARIVNWLYPKVQTPYIYFLADDDLIDPDGLARLVPVIDRGVISLTPSEYADVAEFDTIDAVYGRCEVVDEQADGSYKHGSWCFDAGDVGLGTNIDPKCRLDGGQVLHTKRLWEQATADGWTLTNSKEDAAANDGTLLSRLAQFARFHYVPQRIVTHRRHSSSTYHKPQLGG